MLIFTILTLYPIMNIVGISLRSDNADIRLTQKGIDIGLVLEQRKELFLEKHSQLKKIQYKMDKLKISPTKVSKFGIKIAKDGILRTASNILAQKSVTMDKIREASERKRDGRYKYHEAEIIQEIEDYVSSTYNGHYTGTKHEFRNVQTIDLMASRDLASDFCQANILKYGSRYGSKDGRNKKDLLKVIHYAMLLLHFDEHYGKPKMTSGNIDHNMP